MLNIGREKCLCYSSTKWRKENNCNFRENERVCCYKMQEENKVHVNIVEKGCDWWRDKVINFSGFILS